MRCHKLFLPTLLLCAGCASGPNIFGLSSKEKTSNIDTNPLIPKENFLTRSNESKYAGELVYKITDAELSATQAGDFILVVSGATNKNIAYEPRLVIATPKQPNTLRVLFKAIHEPDKRKEEGTITAAITIIPEEFENINKILIESKKSTFELKL